MLNPNDYVTTNRVLWDKKTPFHTASAFYAVDDFVAGTNTLKEIELDLLGEIKDKTVLHLQCHFGQDTLSLARMGAKVTGADFSGVAIEAARALNDQLQLDAQFICSNIYDLPSVHTGQYDIVFSSYGTIVWLADIAGWAKVVETFLRPGGRFIFAETHPLTLMYDDNLTSIIYPYFNKGMIVENEQGTYADREADITLPSNTWNHSLADVLQSLINAGLSITAFREYDYAPHACFGNMVEVAPGRFQIKGMEGMPPLVYALEARKPND
jgi:SAM-dependent methyltransferase